GRRIGLHLACQCGSCSHTVARCEMFGCFAQTTREEIARMSASGMSDQAILDHYIAKHGQQIYRAQPSAFGWLVPYLALLPGAALIYWFIRRYRRPALVLATGGRPGGPAAPAIDPRYLAQIEKDLE
ncbi:MAG: cytochrome c-type biogenesis protein CcmH, partial [Acidobacteria bacterium]|nr:cytochrome c-type biogenesis protein CcmH [Acidobacteriota bacterium]